MDHTRSVHVLRVRRSWRPPRNRLPRHPEIPVLRVRYRDIGSNGGWGSVLRVLRIIRGWLSGDLGWVCLLTWAVNEWVRLVTSAATGWVCLVTSADTPWTGTRRVLPLDPVSQDQGAGALRHV